jgi:hypothetical protein
MKVDRRNFIATALAGGAYISLPIASAQPGTKETAYTKLDEAAKRPVLKTQLFSRSVIIETLDLLKFRGNYLCRVRSKDGAEGFSFANNKVDSSD